jgi:hypothetical protein
MSIKIKSGIRSLANVTPSCPVAATDTSWPLKVKMSEEGAVVPAIFNDQYFVRHHCYPPV